MEPRYVIIKGTGRDLKYLRHEGHKHFWTPNRSDAMEYTKIDVAQALAEQNGGIVKPI